MGIRFPISLSVSLSYSGSYTSIEDGKEKKACMAACEGHTYQVTASSSLYPVPSTYSHTPMFCQVVRKIGQTCQDQAKVTLELVYPRICELVAIVHSHNACDSEYKPEMIPQWKNGESNKFSDLILKYTKENIVQVNIYIKDPFAVKFLIEENASK